MNNVDKAINKLSTILEKKRLVRVYECAIMYLDTQVKHDVYTKEQSRLRTEHKFYINEVKKLKAEIKSFE